MDLWFTPIKVVSYWGGWILLLCPHDINIAKKNIAPWHDALPHGLPRRRSGWKWPEDHP